LDESQKGDKSDEKRKKGGKAKPCADIRISENGTPDVGTNGRGGGGRAKGEK